MPAPPGASPDRGDLPILGGEQRLEDIASTIQEFAALRFEARAQIGPDGDIVDAVAAGVNFLGAELEASFSEIEPGSLIEPRSSPSPRGNPHAGRCTTS